MSSSPTEPERAAVEVTMPETGAPDGALLISWLKRPGSAVEADEPICLVRVGDLTAEIVSPAAGVIGAIYAEAGRRALPGSSLAEVLPAPVVELAPVAEPDLQPEPEVKPEVEAESEPEFEVEPELEAEVEVEPEPEPEPEPEVEVELEPEAEPEPDPEPKPDPEPEPDPEPAPILAAADPLADLATEIASLEIALPEVELTLSAEPAPPPPPAAPPKPPAPVEPAEFRSPAVRRLAATHGIELDGLRGSGRGGRVTREDVLAAVDGG